MDETADLRDFTPERLRELLHRKTMAGETHRAAAARLLALDDTEAAALGHFAQHGQLTPGELGTLLGLTSGGTTALIHRLLASGFLAKHPNPRDKRSYFLTATPSALEQTADLYAPLVEAINVAAGRLPETERAIIGRFLEEIVDLSERHAVRLSDLARAEERQVVGPPTPGLWA